MAFKIHFSPIDGKEMGIFYIMGERGEVRVKSEHNWRISEQLTMEYLQGLRALQNQLKAKYEEQFVEEAKDIKRDYDMQDRVSEEVNGIYKRQNPDDDLDDLWYS